jgi:hypothetical protein
MAKLSDHAAALKHQYRVVHDGPSVPGVTTVIGILSKPALVWSAAEIADKTAVDEGRRKTTIVRRHRKRLQSLGKKERELGFNGSDYDVYIHYCRGEHKRQWDAKADRGTRVHEVAERWTKAPGEPVSVLVEDSRYVDALSEFYRDYKPKFLMAECVVLNAELGFGGRFDAIVQMEGGTYILDYKTGGYYASSLAMQQVGYMQCRLATYNEDGSLGELTELPKLDGARGLYLKDDGTYEVVDPFKNISQDLAWEGFTSCLKLYNAMKEIDKATKENA